MVVSITRNNELVTHFSVSIVRHWDEFMQNLILINKIVDIFFTLL